MFRPVKVRQYLALMKEKGHTTGAVLAGSGVTQERLGGSDFLMVLHQSRIILSNMIKFAGGQGVGLEMGSRTDSIDLGLVGYLVVSSRSIREAVQHWVKYNDALIGMPMTVGLEERAPDDWSLVIDESVPLGFIFNFCVEELLVMMVKLAGEISGTTPVIDRIELSYPAPVHHELYSGHFKCPLKFNSARTRITFFAPGVDKPLRGNDPEFNQICERQCEMLARQIGQGSPFVAKIRNILMRSRGGSMAIDKVASELCMSPRTLSRHLHAEGVSYQQVVSEYRIDMAREYLRSVSMTTKEIAYFLGFKDTDSFRRAFKHWTGKTVQGYRKELTAAEASVNSVETR